METLSFSKSEIESQFSDCVSLEDLIFKLEKSTSLDSKVICRISINGMEFSENDEQKFAGTNLSDIESVKIEINDFDSVIKNAIELTVVLLKSIKSRSLSLAEQTRLEPHRFQAVEFAEIVSQIQELIQALISLEPHFSSGKALQTLKTRVQDISQWSPAVSHMAVTVKELCEAYERNDLVLVSDVLEYEISNNVEEWERVFSGS